MYLPLRGQKYKFFCYRNPSAVNFKINILISGKVVHQIACHLYPGFRSEQVQRDVVFTIYHFEIEQAAARMFLDQGW